VRFAPSVQKRVGMKGQRMRLLLVLVGGALGAAARYLVSTWMARRFGTVFPWGTITVNIVGSFLIGLIATLADEAGAVGPSVRVFLVVGMLGGFTTFSSFSLETLRLLEQGDALRAGLNVLGNLAISGAAVVLGVTSGRGVT
jgi:CrcB protein